MLANFSDAWGYLLFFTLLYFVNRYYKAKWKLEKEMRRDANGKEVIE